MNRSLIILAFIIAVAVNSLAAVTPHMDGDGGCSAACCQAARQHGPGANFSKLRCLIDCSQPGSAESPSPAYAVINDQNKKASAALFAFRVEVALLFQSSNAARSMMPIKTATTDVYLKTGALLI
ncbi:MAG TPA: hypothetical protein VNN73_16655 [Blastocatellia bacterium]|nr:hypothetical protein [Blastocatellia bacterium]